MLNWIPTAIDYNYWGHHRLWNGIMALSKEDFVRPVAYSIGSVKQQIVHTMWAEAIWYTRIHDQPRPGFTADDFVDRAAIRAQWDEIEANWRAYIGGMTAEELARPVNIVRANGERFVHTPLEIIMHMVNHGTDHRSQILRLLHDYGAPTFEQDIAYYLRGV